MQHLTLSSMKGKLVLAATILASGMAFLDGTVVNIAVPVIQSKLHATLGGIQWMINSYTLMLAALILISGSLGDRYGRKKIFISGIILFLLSSFLCSIAHSIEQLIAFRTLQGIGGAMMIPGSLSIINSSFSDNVHGKVIGLWSGFAGGVAALGPFVGGWLVQTFDWPSIFFINLPIGIVALLLTVKFVPESKNPHAKRLDILGTFFIFISLLCISFGLIQAPEMGWSHGAVMTSLIVGLLCFIAFIITEKKVAEPIMPLSLFTSPLVSGANIVTLFLYFALNGVIFFLILNVQQLQHFTPLMAGLSMLPSILIITFLSGPAGSLSDKIGPRLPMIIGPLLVSVGMMLLTFAGKQANYFRDFLPGLVLFGLGMALVIAPLTKSALAVDHRLSGAASGINNAVSRIAALLAIALLGAIVASVFSMHLTQSLAASQLQKNEQQQILEQKSNLAEIVIPSSFTAEQQLETKTFIEDAFLDGYRWAMGIGAFLAFISSIVAMLTIQNSLSSKKN
jgi:EmrB/QacA subfamily drug resistance transporter